LCMNISRLLESESGAVVGCITLDRDHRWAGNTYILDMFMHKNFAPHYDTLLNSMQLPDHVPPCNGRTEGKIQCYIAENSSDEKIKALQKSGFEQEAMLKKQFSYGSESYNVFLYSKFI